MKNKGLRSDIDNSNLADYPNGQIKDNVEGLGGTEVSKSTKSDLHECFDKLMRLYDIPHNDLFDNETNGYQTVEALRALANKNDFIEEITEDDGKLVVPFKLEYLLNNESFVLKATVNKGSETVITGSDSYDKNITFLGDFKSGEYVRMINTTTNVILVRLVDYSNISSVLSDLLFFPRATQTESNTGTENEKFITPLLDKTTFARRVTGTDSGSYLATSSNNGLMPSSVFGSIPINRGYFSGFDIGGGSVGDTFTVGGDLASATIDQDGGSYSVIRVVFNNSMNTNNYYAGIHIETKNSDILDSEPIGQPVFKVINNTTIDIVFGQTGTETQSLTVHLETVKY